MLRDGATIREQESIDIVHRFHPTVRLVPVGRGDKEYKSTTGCPECRTGGGKNSDRFKLIFESDTNAENWNPHVWCRHCHYQKFVNLMLYEMETGTRTPSKVQQVEEPDKAESAIEIADDLTARGTHLQYYINLYEHQHAVEYWHSQGITEQSIEKYKLGYCNKCPTYPPSSSFTIPIMAGGKVWNIRHRLEFPNGSGKYRPERAGVSKLLFNADNLTRRESGILVLEGEKKSIVVSQETGLANVSITGKNQFDETWVGKFKGFKDVFICLDPDAESDAMDIVKLFGRQGRLVSLPVKADDFFTIYGGTKSDFMSYINDARRL